MDTLGRIDQFIREIDAAEDVEAVTIALRKQIDLLEFELFSYQVFTNHDGRRASFYITGYPREWDLRYQEKNYASLDIIGRHAARVMRPFHWLEIGRFDKLLKEQQTIFNEGAAFGIRGGASVPIHGPGLTKAQFTVASNIPQDRFIKLFQARRHEVQLVATYMHERISQMGFLDVPPTNLYLTPREIDVLTWTARGKNRQDIADITSHSDETIKKQLKSACDKLNASNKTHAVAVALIHGLILP